MPSFFMIKKIALCLRLKSERGVIIPVAAVIALSVFVVLMILGIDSAQVHRKAAILRNHASRICSIIVEQAPLQGAAAISFAAEVNALDTTLSAQGVRLDRARVILPTMPTSAARPSGIDTGAMDSDNTANPPFLSNARSLCGPSAPLQSHPVCTNANSFCASADPDNTGFQRCIFQGDVHYNNPRFAPGSPVNSTRYPVSMMHNLSHAGNTAICELEGSIGSSMLPTVRRNFRGVAGWRIPAVGYPPSPPSISGWSTNDIPYPGLSVAIAPHMTTWTDVIGGTDNRFQFINSLYSGNAQDNLPWNLHNPLSFNAPPQAFHANSGSDSYLSNPTHQLPAAPSDTAEARAACANPAVLTRNIFSSIILELASRHGMMRADTELLLVGTQNRDLTAVDRPPPRANFPALITPMNFDIAAQGFQLPFISYFSGNANITAGFPVTDRLSNSNTFALGFVNPFDTTGPAIDYSTLLSNQLRYCYHLYAPQTPPTNPPTSALARHAPLPRDASNQGFEDIFAFQDMIYPPGLRTAQANGATPWASPCPWNANMSTCIPANGARRLTAAEVAGSLGTIQSCPYPIANPITLTSCDKSLFLNDNNSTSNANRATLDLRPDLIGLLKYLAADSYAAATFPAIMPPGLFPYNFNAGAASGFTNTDYPFGNSTTFYAETPQRDAAGRSSSTILIILHQRINFNDIAIISPLVDALNTTDSNGDVHKRPITIAYFPTTAADADPTAIGNLVAAFNANIFGTDPKRNSLLIFSPDQLAGASAAFNSQLLATCLPTQTACRFQKYWHHLLSQPPTSADSIFFQARDVFQTRLVNKGILF